jgi:hypothetical protein
MIKIINIIKPFIKEIQILCRASGRLPSAVSSWNLKSANSSVPHLGLGGWRQTLLHRASCAVLLPTRLISGGNSDRRRHMCCADLFTRGYGLIFLCRYLQPTSMHAADATATRRFHPPKLARRDVRSQQQLVFRLSNLSGHRGQCMSLIWSIKDSVDARWRHRPTHLKTEYDLLNFTCEEVGVLETPLI